MQLGIPALAIAARQRPQKVVFDAPLLTTLNTGIGAGTFTRNSTALDPDDYASVAIDVARFSADGWFGEPQRTNLVTHSSELDNVTGWPTLINCTIGANESVAPDGTSTMDAIDSGTVVSAPHRAQTAAFTVTAANDAYVGSAYVKAGDVDWCALTIMDSGSRGVRRYFNIATGEKGVVVDDFNAPDTPQQFDVEDVGGGIYRVAVGMKNNASSTTMTFQVWPADSDGGLSYAAADTTTAQIYAWGVQLEKSDLSGPTTLIPTSGAAATREADDLLYADEWDWTNDIAGSIDWTPSADDQGEVWFLGNYTDASNAVGVLHDGTNAIARKRIAGVDNDATKALDYVVGTTYNIKWRFSSTEGVDIWVEEVKGTNDPTTTDATVDTDLSVGNDGNGAFYQAGSIKSVRIEQGNLNDAEVVSL
jgi:hypothetical protein